MAIKILKQGKIPQYQTVCDRCDTEFVYEDSDCREGAFCTYFIYCPLCGKSLNVTERLEYEEDDE